MIWEIEFIQKEPEMRSWVQVVYLEDDPWSEAWGSEKGRDENQ